jgi:hypothetical protein
MSKCGQCGFDSPKRKDRYCAKCRKIYNAKRDLDKARQTRADTYYWDVTVPKLRARLDAKTPMPMGKMGVYHPLPIHEYDSESWKGLLYRRTGDRVFDD